MIEATLDPDQHLARVQELTATVENLEDGYAKAVAEDLVGAIVELYGEGLTRIVTALNESEGGAAFHQSLIDDGVVASLLLIHDLYPVSLESRVKEALELVRPYMESHGGDIEILAVENGVAHLKLVGHCKGCPASQATLENTIKDALQETAPDLLGLEVEGVIEPKLDARMDLPTSPGAIPLTVVNGGGPAPTPTWMALDSTGDVEPGDLQTTLLQGVELIVANVDGTLLAYRSTCASCGAGLGNAALTGGTLECQACNHTFELPRAGRSLTDDALQLEPVPLLDRGRREAKAAPA